MVLGAEFTAKGDRDYEVNTDKHATLVGEMAKGLAKLPANKKDRPFKQLGIIQTLTSQLDKGGDKSQGVYQKTGKKADPNHISIEVSIKKKWLKELATV